MASGVVVNDMVSLIETLIHQIERSDYKIELYMDAHKRGFGCIHGIHFLNLIDEQERFLNFLPRGQRVTWGATASASERVQ